MLEQHHWSLWTHRGGLHGCRCYGRVALNDTWMLSSTLHLPCSFPCNVWLVAGGVPEAPPPIDPSSLKLSDVPWLGFVNNVPVLALLGVHCSANAGALLCCPIVSQAKFYGDRSHSLAAGISNVPA